MAARKKSDLTYTKAAEELQSILDEMESGEADLDVLDKRVERAAELIRFCRESLAGTELRVQKIVDELADDSEAEPATNEED
ncbi:MAG: exodeoxyribonuclease VII small subunit [Planctomycetota bacterium]